MSARATEPEYRSLAVIIPTYNEESVIEALLARVCELGADEIFVSDGSSSDRTVEIAARYRKVNVIHGAACRAEQMNRAARIATSDVLLFLHADVMPFTGAADAIRRALEDPEVVGGNFTIAYEGKNLTSACFSYINRVRQRWGIFYGDSGIFCRRDVFESLGGYKSWTLMEDYDFARRLVKFGRIEFLREPIFVSDRRWRKAGRVTTVLSWTMIQALYLAGISPNRLARWYRIIR